jgi:hypothetical protein
VAFNASGLSISYRIGTGSAVAITLTSGNWFEIGGGKYYVDVADSVYAAGNLGSLVQFYGALTGSSVYGEQHRVVGYNPLAVALGANTTTPPTAAANASAVRTELTTELGRIDQTISSRSTFAGGAVASVTAPVTVGTNNDKLGYSLTSAERTAIADRDFSALTAGPSTGGAWPNGSFGERLLVGDTTTRAVKVTGAGHAAADVHEFQPDTINSDAIATSAITEIAAGVWSAASSAYSAATGTMGLIMYAFSQMLENVSGWRWKATSLSQAPSGTSTVTVLPALGVAAGRGDRTTLVAYVAETITTSITVYQADGTTAYNLSGQTLTVIFENPKTGDDVAVVASGSITISGTDSNVVTFAYPAAATSAQRELTWTLRDASAPRTVYLRGVLEVRAAATVDP